MNTENYVVYFILDEKSNAMKIGYAANVDNRFSTIQTGNPNSLVILNTIKCRSEQHAAHLERELHNRFHQNRLRGEWFTFNLEVFKDLLKEEFNFEPKQKREPLINSTLWGDQKVFDPQTHPRCFFYENYVAQIKHSYEKSFRFSIPFRTMEYPTYGKQMLGQYSKEVNKVFISTKKHLENLELNRFQRDKQLKLNAVLTANTVENFIIS